MRLSYSQMSLRQKDLFLFLNVALLMINLYLMLIVWKDYRQSGFFRRSLDLNMDDYVTLEEWMAYYGPQEHPWSEFPGRDFQPADCDGDLRLSWSEYRSARFGQRYCGNRRPPFSEWSFKRPVRNPDTGAYVLVPPTRLPPKPPILDPMGAARAGNLPGPWPEPKRAKPPRP